MLGIVILYRPDGKDLTRKAGLTVRTSCRDALIDAAESIVVEEGAARLTLDAVAERANVSKGGLLYHFPNKDALLEAMLARLIEQIHVRRSTAFETTPEGPARELVAEVRAHLDSPGDCGRLGVALLAALANDPKLVSGFTELNSKVFDTLRSMPGSFERKLLVVLAAKGLFFMELLQVTPLTPEQRKRLVDELMTVAEEVCQPQ